MRAAIYARYSSDLQTDASIEDQIRIVEERAKAEGWTIVNRYTDHGISGASMMRPGIQMLMQDAAAGKFEIVLAEAMDRLSRDQEEIAGIYKRLQFSGVKIFTMSEGEVSNLHIGLKGTMNAMFLKDLADKTRRGLRGRVEQGKSGGGLTYGYDVVRKFDERGEPICGERKINEEEANIVIRIFKEYAIGKSPQAIARQLNKEGIKAPTATGWNPSTIHGNPKRGTGIINNELYVGKLIWNRLRYIKNPDTGKRVSRMNPKEQWITKDVPEMRIVPDNLWESVKLRQEDLARKPNISAMQRPKLLFSGLLKCGCCGCGYTKISKNQYGCFAARKKGTCDNFETIRQDELESKVLHALQTHLMTPDMCEVFCTEYARYMNDLFIQHNAKKRGYEKELARRIRDDDRMVRMVLDGVASTASMKDRINENAYRIEELKTLLEGQQEVPTLLHPNMGKHYQREVATLIKSMNSQDHRHEAADVIRGLIEKIVLSPKEGQKGVHVDLIGDLAGILKMATGDKSPLEKRELIEKVKVVSNELNTAQAKALPYKENTLVQDSMVAGAGFEPAAFRL